MASRITGIARELHRVGLYDSNGAIISHYSPRIFLVPILTSVVSVAHRFNTTLTEKKKNGANKIKDLKLVPDLLPLPLVSTPSPHPFWS